MRFLILNADYPDFLEWLYAHHEGMEQQPYAEQLRMRYESLYGVADFYSSNLRALGHEAEDLYANNEWLQRAWAAEQGMVCETAVHARGPSVSVLEQVRRVARRTPIRHVASYVRSWLPKGSALPAWSREILLAQVQRYKPDVLLVQAMDVLPGSVIQELKPFVRAIVGQHAATSLSEDENYSGYDLVVSSFQPTVAWCRARGLHARLSRLGFEPRVLSCLTPTNKTFDVTFSGSFSAVHRSREVWLEGISRSCHELQIWGPDIRQLPQSSPLRKHYQGLAWGRDMYQVLRASKITLNHHGDVAPYANNMRLFEATGVGTCLITDWKDNLGELFEPGKEVLAYRSVEECVELIRHYLAHEEEREAIGRAAQARTLREHTYFHRMQELVDIVEPYV